MIKKIKKMFVWLGLAKDIVCDICVCSDASCGKVMPESKMKLLRIKMNGRSTVTHFCPGCYKKMTLGMKEMDVTLRDK